MHKPRIASCSAGSLSRRAVLAASAAEAAAFVLGTAPAAAHAAASKAKSAASKAKPGDLTPLQGFPRMVQEHFVECVRRAEAEGLARQAALRTKADAQKYVETVRAKILESFGPLPEKTPLNPKITGVVERDAYKIEKLIFQSRPEFYVTGNLYVPKGASFPCPALWALAAIPTTARPPRPTSRLPRG